jgi:GNAT superfamily N-acetyltransferase
MANTLRHLDRSGISVETYDVNLDFFSHHLFTSGHLNDVADVIKRKHRQGVFETVDPATAALLSDCLADNAKWRTNIDNAGTHLQLLRTMDFFQPERCLAALKNIDSLLRLISLAYHPTRMEWDRCFAPTIEGWDRVYEFIDDADVNPFLTLCRRKLAGKLKQPALKLLILSVSTPSQVLAALTIARFSKQRRRHLHVAMIGNNHLPAGAARFDVTLLADTEPEPLLDLIGRLGGRTASRRRALPKFSALPLQEYLSPVVVLPVRGRFEESRLDLTSAPFFRDDLARYQQAFGAEGFLSEDERLSPTYVAQQPVATKRKTSSPCLGLSCPLAELIEPDTMDNAYRAGVRLIRWHHPSGPFESLGKTLWHAAKAGIWNHVIMPDRPENSLDRELLQFMAANPNIVHSWVRSRQQTHIFSDSIQRADRLGVYTNVAPLPGRPLWHFLQDPVHLLLYLNRFGTKKMLRWRVREQEPWLYVLGENISYYFVKPQDLSSGYLDDICRMVEAGGSVDTTLVRYNLERAYLIGYALEDGVIVGNSSLKRPRTEYVEAVNRQSGLDLSDYLERGYTSVRPEYRGMGIGAKLLAGLTARVGDLKLFSIISADNVAAQKMALRNRTRQVASFYSEKLGKEVGVWMPEWMIED